MVQPGIYKYAVLMAIPSARRGERVNIGMVVFRPDRLDVRVPAAAKLACLASGEWDAYIAGVTQRLAREFVPGQDPSQFAVRFSLIEPVVRMSEMGWFLVESEGQYETQIADTLAEL